MIQGWEVKQIARAMGFEEVGITRLEKLSSWEARLESWLQDGRHGSMKYLEDFKARRRNLFENFPEARSVIVLGLNYYSSEIASAQKGPRNDVVIASEAKQSKIAGRVARYAWGKDYHSLIRKKHASLLMRLKEISGEDFKAESCVDTKPLPERFAAFQAGFGFIGKNTMLLSRRFGPWLFLSEIVTNLDLEEDAIEEGSCGTCVRCQKVCPTGALDADYQMDARLCIAYLTIEHKGVIPRELRPKIKDWVFGCDECLTVCPFTAHQTEAQTPELLPQSGTGEWLDFDELFGLTSNSIYEKRFEETALLRSSRKQMLRNACIVLGNSGRREAIPYLEKAMREESELVRIHAAWALGRLPFTRSREILNRHRLEEPDQEVIEEIDFALKKEEFLQEN